jgi:hypothetical protein
VFEMPPAMREESTTSPVRIASKPLATTPVQYCELAIPVQACRHSLRVIVQDEIW